MVSTGSSGRVVSTSSTTRGDTREVRIPMSDGVELAATLSSGVTSMVTS